MMEPGVGKWWKSHCYLLKKMGMGMGKSGIWGENTIKWISEGHEEKKIIN